MSNSMITMIMTVFIAFAVWAGGYSHESDLIRQCKEQNTLKLWHSGYDVECKITPTQKAGFAG